MWEEGKWQNVKQMMGKKRKRKTLGVRITKAEKAEKSRLVGKEIKTKREARRRKKDCSRMRDDADGGKKTVKRGTEARNDGRGGKQKEE